MDKTGKRRKKKRLPLWLRLFFLVVVLLLFFGAAEGIFRVFGWKIKSGDMGRSDRLLYFDVSAGDESMDRWLVVGVNIYPLESGQYRVDKPLEPKKSKDIFRIVCLGDSSTIGDGVEAGQTYCAQLENILAEKWPAKKVEAYNCGFYGYSSYQGRTLMEKYYSVLQPDAVVFYFGANDAVFAPLREDKDWQKVPPWALEMNQTLYDNSQFYRLLRNINVRYVLQAMVHPFNSNKRNLFHRQRVRIEDFFANLQATEKLSEKGGGKVYIVPYLSLAGEELIHAAYFDRYSHDRMIDLEPAFLKIIKQGRSPFVDGIHPSPEGHKIIAQMLSDLIEKDFTPVVEN